MRGPRSQIEGTGVEEEGTALGPHYHRKLRKADVVANSHSERKAVGGLDDGDAEGGRKGGMKGVVREMG